MKNDLEEIKEKRNAYYQNSDNQSTNKKDLSNLGNDTEQYIKGNNNKKIDSNSKNRKQNKT